MATNKKNINRASVNLLPTFFRTEKNSKFLASTLDQLVKAPALERIDGFVGSKLTNSYTPLTDFYISDTTALRDQYQLEPGLVVTAQGGIGEQAVFGFDDLINQISYHGGNVSDINRLFGPTIHSYNPHIDWDKFINFRNYFWMPTGPDSITIAGLQRNTKSTYKVTDSADGNFFIFTPDGLTSDPLLVLYRGLTYVFNIESAHKMYFKTADVTGTDELYTQGITGSGTSSGQIVFTVDDRTPSVLYYTSADGQQLSGRILVKDIVENSTLDVDQDIIGKISYSSGNGIEFINGIKINFVGNITPASYANKEFIVEGVGTAIKLVEFTLLTTPDSLATVPDGTSNFDGTLFDEYPFDNFKNLPITPEYITINRSSLDLNPWSRYNRWFHSDVILASAKANGIDTPVFDMNNRGSRPIIEFRADIQLWNFGKSAIVPVDIIDEITTDVFSVIENSVGYYVDGVAIADGQRVIFNADIDPLLCGKIYEVSNVIINGIQKFNLTEVQTVDVGTSVVVQTGDIRQGTSWWFNGINWTFAQQRTVRNQFPLFDLFDVDGISYGNKAYYNSTFAGNEIFGYSIGTGAADSVLGFSLDYKNIGIEGTYLFKNYFSTSNVVSIDFNVTTSFPSSKTYLRMNDTDAPTYATVWDNATTYTIPLLPNGRYDTPLNLTNNPLNGPIANFTLTELDDHVNSGGTRLLVNQTPLAFAFLFLAYSENSLITATRRASLDYYQFKLNLLNMLSRGNSEATSADVLDATLVLINSNKNSTFLYAQSDMLGYGDNNIAIDYIVTDSRNVNYSISEIFDIDKLSSRSVLVYLNNKLLKYGIDYEFEQYTAGIKILTNLAKGDVLTVKDYISTVGTYVPPTPTKLGLYPKYEPSIFIDNSYVDGPKKVIQGHDGSITLAFSAYNETDDYRDLALLEFETRVFNNLKASYNTDLINIDNILPSVFRKGDYTYNEVYDLVQGDFLKWTSTYGLDFATNTSYDVNNHKTYNFKSATDYLFNNKLPGSWRSIYKFYFDTDRPNTHPWEMLGFTIKPTWWEGEYGPAPYTSGNLNLWEDLEAGRIQQGTRKGIDPTYVRAGLSKIIPVDASGNILDFREWAGIAQNDSIMNTNQEWAFGDGGPAETAWKRSSLWPFAVQIILALTKPAMYASLMFDPIRLAKDITGQYNYGPDKLFLNPKTVYLHSDIDSAGAPVLASGYSVWVIENGKYTSNDYLATLKQELAATSFNLVYKAGGFLSKDKLEIIIDSVSPNTVNPGVLLPNEDYKLHFNVSTPVRTASISGIIVETNNGQFVVKGYDKNYPYFTINSPIHRSAGAAVTVGGKTETLLEWRVNSLYQAGQVVYYASKYYRVISSHNSGTSFTASKYTVLSKLPIVGGVSVLSSTNFESTSTDVPYGTRYDTLQEVYDLIVGYGHWLETQGFVFNEYNQDLAQVLDWRFTGKEFLYWTTQNWADGTIITLSPFASSITYTITDAVVDNVLDSFYEYSLLKANGEAFPATNFSLSREGGVCTITTKNTTEGLFFVRLNLVQKEHVIIMNNTSMFNDVIYDMETGYRQRRIKLTGFRTADWHGEFLSPGFIYDDAQISSWVPYVDHKSADIVKYAGKYYSAIRTVNGSATFDFVNWTLLGDKPIAQLLPNFDYKINQFEDFYSLDIDNFDKSQQRMAQHLVGYTPRTYLDNIFVNPIAQYKFYQGFIKEKGTKNAIDKLAKASVHNLQGQIVFNEEWAFRVGEYGNFTSYNEIELPLREADFRENSQIVKFVETSPMVPNDTISYINPTDIVIKPTDYDSNTVFSTITASYADNNFLLPTAGYVRADDVTASAYNNNSLLDIANNGSINEGDTIWLGFKFNGDWDVYRYTRQVPNILNSEIAIPGTTITFTTDIFHNLSVGDIVSIHGLDNGSDGVYIVKYVQSLNTFSVASTLSTLSVSNTSALLFKFVSVRISEFDSIADLQNTITFRKGDLVWADNNPVTNGWEVYQKTNNYKSVEFDNTVARPNQSFGSQISTQDDANTVVISAPDYYSSITPAPGHGRIFVYERVNESLYPITSYSINKIQNEHYPSSDISKFGASLVYDVNTDLIFAGAPLVGIVKISAIDRDLLAEGQSVVLSTSTVSYGSSLFVNKTTSTVVSAKVLLVGAPDSDVIFTYSVITDGTAITVASVGSITATITSATFGHAISGNNDGSRVAVAAPGENGIGAVHILTYPYVDSVTISAPAICNIGDNFGTSILMSEDGTYLFVSSTINDNINNAGKVFVYKWNTTASLYVLTQSINNPSNVAGLLFGTAIAVDSLTKTLIVSSSGTNTYPGITFDNASTTFDDTTLQIVDIIVGAGSASVFTRYFDKFIYAEELLPADFSIDAQYVGSSYGASVAINGELLFVGAPQAMRDGSDNGNIHIFSKIDSSINSWNLYRFQDNLIDLTKLKRTAIIDTTTDQIVDYLDIIDPVKGRIAGLADQEIRYKTAFDPAVYSIGVPGVTVDTDTSWIDVHVGELWWDLSTVKYTWYEQGDLEYRKNAWGTLFPGASIDVYEWVKSEYLPSQWSSVADTATGLASGISGQPKYADNSVISVQEYYNATTGSTTNVYYYWVKNTVILPTSNDRKLPASEVARLIYDPAAYGTKFVSVLATNAIAVTNVKDQLISDTMYLNISKDTIDNTVNQHTEWLLIEEGSATSMPNSLLNKKLIDSLLGTDSLNNSVPDAGLPERVRYGTGIRPRQTLFKNRTEALRNTIEFTNTILSQNIIRDSISFVNLNSKEEIPDILSGEYDVLVEDEQGLFALSTTAFRTAQLTCEVINGKITEISIVDAGYGYNVAPTVTALLGETDVIITTSIDKFGTVVATTIVSRGSGFIVPPILTVRPYTVIVAVDGSSNNKWAKYQLTSNTWLKVRTQQYDTTQYWDYRDWIASSYNPLTPIVATVAQPYLLEALLSETTVTPLITGDYVKVLNQGNGRYIVLEKVSSNGSFDADFDLIYSEAGTIKFKDTLWNTSNSKYNFDDTTYDQESYDQSAAVELSKIVNSIKEDIFVGPLKVYWNKLFFKAVKYAMSEQIFIDWAFKTSFINVKNLAGSLDQRAVYKLQNSQYYEDYLKEVKPYHTVIRNFQVNYDVVEPTQTYTTDFDLPAVYDQETGIFVPLELGDPRLTVYPQKGWNDNFKLTLNTGYDSIIITSASSGYTSVPAVEIIAAPGDTGGGATAIAYISLGKVIAIEVITAGTGYTQIPSVVITGGGPAIMTPATAYAKLTNANVRSNIIGLKFDRVAASEELIIKHATDSFICDGNTYSFVLTWAADCDKTAIDITLDGITVLMDNYSATTYSEFYNGYHKLYSKVVLTFTPNKGQTLSLTYNKNVNLFHAADRISKFYQPTAGMPGIEMGQLMSGVDYPGTQLQTLPFAYSSYWDTTPFGEASWDTDGIADVDTILDGGDLAYTTALGIDPADVIVDGDQFISANVSHGPEELVPGEVLESLGINVYTRTPSGSPVIVQKMFLVESTSIPTTIPLTIMPANTGTLMLSFNNTIMNYGSDFTIDFNNKTLTVNTQTSTGVGGLTIVGVGGIGFLSSDYSTVYNSSAVSVQSAALFTDIGSTYVTLNGNTLSPSQYTLSTISSKNKRGMVTVTGLTTGTNTLQAWFFEPTYKGYSEVTEQLINVTGTNSTFVINQYPGNSGSPDSQSIVELDKRRLLPPNAAYYTVQAGQLYFKIDPNNTYPIGVFDLSSLIVYRNGIKIRNGIDFILDQVNNRLQFKAKFLTIGDELSITNTMYSDYYFADGNLHVNIQLNVGSVLKVITYTNQDGSLIHTETFVARSSNRYPMSRPIVNDDYVWVSVGGNPLINGFDYYIDSDRKTVVIDSSYPTADLATIIIMSMNDVTAVEVIGYRIFKDILNRTQYKRLSNANSTKLSSPLVISSTTISVDNASMLPVPNPAINAPGVILIDGERVEYMEVIGNILGRIKRATLGTGARDVYPAGTTVIDQGLSQTIPYKDTTVKQHITATTAVSYLLTDIAFNSSAALYDQVEVYYGGAQLRKFTTATVTLHNLEIAYDSGEISASGVASDEVLAPEFEIIDNNGSKWLTITVPNGVKAGTRITVVCRTATDWYDTTGPLLTDTSVQANFLRDRQASLPDKYHYGQN